MSEEVVGEVAEVILAARRGLLRHSIRHLASAAGAVTKSTET